MHAAPRWGSEAAPPNPQQTNPMNPSTGLDALIATHTTERDGWNAIGQEAASFTRRKLFTWGLGGLVVFGIPTVYVLHKMKKL